MGSLKKLEREVYIFVSGKKFSEKEENVVCHQCGAEFSQKEEHFQEAFVFKSQFIDMPDKPMLVGIPFEMANVFVKSRCPYCGFHNQNERGGIFLR